MKRGKFTRILSLVISVLWLCASVSAQLALGPQRLVHSPAPTLRNRTHLRVGLGRRPRISFVGRIGGVAFDAVAKPADGFVVNTLALDYFPDRRDGQRLTVSINDQTVLAPIYDWQLIPIAKFANSGFYSCFTLFGDLANSKKQREVLGRRGRVLNYHPSFENTLLGLRLFQLDSLIINRHSYDLVKNGDEYLLGAGEVPPSISKNKSSLENFRIFNQKIPDNKYNSYVVSDFGRTVAFRVDGDRLDIQGEPSYYFWRMDEQALKKLESGEAMDQVMRELLQEAESFGKSNPQVTERAWLTQQLISTAANYERLIGNYRILEGLGLPELFQLLATKGVAAREALLSQQSTDSLLMQLFTLRTVASVQRAEAMPGLSQMVSSQTRMLRAINPAVWDASVNVMRYAAFFRYCKAKHPQQWRLFMKQIAKAPPLKPAVTTPTIIENWVSFEREN